MSETIFTKVVEGENSFYIIRDLFADRDSIHRDRERNEAFCDYVDILARKVVELENKLNGWSQK